MRISETLLPEFDHEMANTRKTLERIPDEKFTWKPHDKSMAMGRLGAHLANLPTWAVLTLQEDSFDVAPLGGPAPTSPEVHTTGEILELFDKNLAAAREAVANASNEALGETWTLLAGGETVLSLPKIAVLRSFVLNHTIHHRAQLGVYLRLNDIAVPSIYGPSADEG
jgi:uncharacterized damage-inducible protein DinB